MTSIVCVPSSNTGTTVDVTGLPFEASELSNLKIVATPDPGVNLDWTHVTLP